MGFILVHRSSQDFTHCCTLRSEARESPARGLQQNSQVVHRSQRVRMLFTEFGPASGSYLVSCALHRVKASRGLKLCRFCSAAIHTTGFDSTKLGSRIRQLKTLPHIFRASSSCTPTLRTVSRTRFSRNVGRLQIPKSRKLRLSV